MLDARRLELVLLDLGFARVRQKGSHVLYRHGDGRCTAVPHHKGRDLARPLLRSILRDIDLTPDDLAELLSR